MRVRGWARCLAVLQKALSVDMDAIHAEALAENALRDAESWLGEVLL